VALPRPGIPTTPEVHRTRAHRVLTFARRVFHKAEDDAIFFMAGAISFNVLVAFVPLTLFVVGLSGVLLSARVADPGAALVDTLASWLPAIQGDVELTRSVRSGVQGLLGQRRNFTVIGAVLLIWFSTRLVGTLRTALREVFDIAEGRGIIRGKLFDMQVVLVGGVLFGINIGITAVIEAAQRIGAARLDLDTPTLGLLESAGAQALAFVTIWFLFLGVYRYLPARRVPWRTALVAATFTAILHELLKVGFGWYVTEVANYRSTYGNLLTVAVLVFWIYYEALAFILGGEIAQVWTMRRARRLQRAAGAARPTPNDR
jgi:membrane protein